MAKMTRREAIGAIGVATVGAQVAGHAVSLEAAVEVVDPGGQFVQSVSRWGFRRMALPEFLDHAASAGLTAVDFLEPDEWGAAGTRGLQCSTGYGGAGTVEHGINDRMNHRQIVRNLERTLPLAARASVPQIVTFVGNRGGMSDTEGLDNSVRVLQQVVPVAENEGVTLLVELLNSRLDYPDYQGDRTAFGVEIIRRVGSPRVKLLYDIYHMQIMEGNIIQTIRDNSEHIGHYHTGGVPGRHELDFGQELNWPAVCRAIVETGFRGYVAHEFMPTREVRGSLRDTVALCAV